MTDSLQNIRNWLLFMPKQNPEEKEDIPESEEYISQNVESIINMLSNGPHSEEISRRLINRTYGTVNGLLILLQMLPEPACADSIFQVEKNLKILYTGERQSKAEWEANNKKKKRRFEKVFIVDKVQKTESIPTPNRRRLIFNDEIAYLTFENGVIIHVETGTSFTIGREPSNNLVVNYQSVSRNHCKIDNQNGVVTLVDTSKKGTWVNGHQFLNCSTQLKTDDRVKLSNQVDEATAGDAIFKFTWNCLALMYSPLIYSEDCIVSELDPQ
jgi:hypothetical protein